MPPRDSTERRSCGLDINEDRYERRKKEKKKRRTLAGYFLNADKEQRIRGCRKDYDVIPG